MLYEGLKIMVELDGMLGEFRAALEEEINKIKKSEQSSTMLRAGRRTESLGAGYWYRFQVDYAPALPPDTPCKLIVGKEQFDVTVISFEENAIILSARVPLPDVLGEVHLENESTVLMERLIAGVEENALNENTAGRRMLSDVGDAQRLLRRTN